jgi:hypothetical protein
VDNYSRNDIWWSNMNSECKETFDPVIFWSFNLKKSGYTALNEYFNFLIKIFPENYVIQEINIFENDYKGNFNEYYLKNNNLKINYFKDRILEKTSNLNIKNILITAKKLIKEKKIVRFNIKLDISLKNNILIKHLEYSINSIDTKKVKSTTFFVNAHNYCFHLKEVPKKEYENINSIIKKFKNEIIKYNKPESGINALNIKNFENKINEFGFKDSFLKNLNINN